MQRGTIPAAISPRAQYSYGTAGTLGAVCDTRPLSMAFLKFFAMMKIDTLALSLLCALVLALHGGAGKVEALDYWDRVAAAAPLPGQHIRSLKPRRGLLQPELTPSGRPMRPSQLADAPLGDPNAGDATGSATPSSPAITAGPNSSPGNCSLEEGVDFPGGDLSARDDMQSPAECCSACQQTPACAAFTFGFIGGGNRCFLKRRSGWTRQANPQMSSGVVSTPGQSDGGGMPAAWSTGNGPSQQTIETPDGKCTAEPGTNFDSADLAVRTGVNSAIECCALCHRTPPCGAWTWGFSGKQQKCFLKFATGWSRVPNSDLTSGATL